MTAENGQYLPQLAITENRLLSPVYQVNIPYRTQQIESKRFFENARIKFSKEGPSIWSLEKNDKEAETFSSGRCYVGFLLREKSYDRSIRRFLPEEHLSTINDIADMVILQERGQQGILLTHSTNIFYVAPSSNVVYVVVVNWINKDENRIGHWQLVSCELDRGPHSDIIYNRGRWRKDTQIICPVIIA